MYPMIMVKGIRVSPPLITKSWKVGKRMFMKGRESIIEYMFRLNPRKAMGILIREAPIV